MLFGARVVVIGWHGSSERNLRSIGRIWQALGVEPSTVVPDTWRGMSRADGWRSVGVELADRVARENADGRPLVIHAFSNAGFWTTVALLDALARVHPEVHARVRGLVIDSAPGFPERVGPLFTAEYAAMAMAPQLLATLGRRPRHRHWLVTPPLMLFLGFWHLIAKDQVRFMETSQARLLALVGAMPITVLYGEMDELVPHRFVEAFIERASRRGPVRAEHFAGSGHVRHLATHRHRYLEALRSAIASAAPPS